MTQIAPRTIFMVAQRPSDFTEMRRCALALHKFGWTIQIIYFFNNFGNKDEFDAIEEVKRLTEIGVFSHADIYMDGVKAKKYDVSQSYEQFMKSTSAKGRKIRLSKILPKKLRSILANKNIRIPNFISEIINLFIVIYMYQNNAKIFRKCLSHCKPDAVVLAEEVVGAITPSVVKAAHDMNIPAVVLPYTICNQSEAFRSLHTNESYHYSHWANKLVGRMFPSWVRKKDAIELVRMPAPYILGQVLARTAPPDPWMMNSGFANVIAVENDAMLEFYLESGIPKTKMRVVGAIADDDLAQFKLNKSEELKVLRAELGISNTKPLFVVGGCPNQLGFCPDGFEFENFEDFVENLVEALKPLKDDYQIIIRPHPNNQAMGELFEQNGLPSTSLDTARLAALSDAYIGFASATIRWAMVCAVPTINYDVFNYDYDDYKGINGVVHVDSYAQLKKVLKNFHLGTKSLKTLQSEIDETAKKWGVLDGRSTQRITELIDEMCQYEKVPRTTE